MTFFLSLKAPCLGNLKAPQNGRKCWGIHAHCKGQGSPFLGSMHYNKSATVWHDIEHPCCCKTMFPVISLNWWETYAFICLQWHIAHTCIWLATLATWHHHIQYVSPDWLRSSSEDEICLTMFKSNSMLGDCKSAWKIVERHRNRSLSREVCIFFNPKLWYKSCTWLA